MSQRRYNPHRDDPTGRVSAPVEKNRRRLISGLYGLAIVLVSIWLDESGKKLISHAFLLSAFALTAPVGLAIVTGIGFRKRWFWIALVICCSGHLAFLWLERNSMPFDSLGVAIFVGAIESMGLVCVSAKVLQLLDPTIYRNS
jgi:hypothetical protein